MSVTHDASGKRHDVPERLRAYVAELKTLTDRYAAAMGRSWVPDDALTERLEALPVEIARLALAVDEQHKLFLRNRT